MSAAIVERETGNVVGGAHRFTRGRHKQGCKCGGCDREPVRCPYDGCDPERTFPGRFALGAHVAQVHRRRKRSFARIVVPDGHGYLHAVLRDPARAAGLHLGELPKFAEKLYSMQNEASRRGRSYGRKKHLKTKILLADAKELYDRDPAALFRLFGFGMPVSIAYLALQLANETLCDPKVIAIALLSYGLESLARELRSLRTAPAPHVPSGTIVLPRADG